MTVSTLPEVRPVDTGDDDLVHLECCGNRALCDGSRLDGDYDADGIDCVVCLDLDEADVRCGGLFCRGRQWLRNERSRPW